MTDTLASPQYFDWPANPELVVATLALGAGNYILNAKVLVGNISGEANEDILCALRYGGPSASLIIDQTSVRPHSGAGFAAGSLVTLALTGGVSLAEDDVIKFICATSIPLSETTFPSGAVAHLAKLNAVKVETLTVQ